MEIELLFKKIEGTLSEDEARQVDVWLAEAESHRKYFQRLQRNYPAGERQSSLSIEEFMSNRASLLGRLNELRRTRRRRWFAVFSLAVAAVICVALFAGWHILFSGSPELIDQTEVVAQNDDAAQQPLVCSFSKKKVSNRCATLSVKGGRNYAMATVGKDEIPLVEYDEEKQTMVYSPDLASEVPVEVHRLSTQPGAELSVVLTDGTQIWLNSDSEISYPTLFTGKDRVVTLKGEAYFKVAKDTAHPFLVKTDGVEVRVYGTEFNVNTRRNKSIATTLVEGSVAISNVGKHGETILKPGQTGEFSLNSRKLDIKEDDIELYIGWKNGFYQFDHASIGFLFDEISHWYGIEVALEDQSLNNECFSGIISRDTPLNQILEILEQTNYVRFHLNGNKLLIKNS